MEKLIERFIKDCEGAISMMLEEESEPDGCEEIYKKYRSIFLMFDMVNLMKQRRDLPEKMVEKMKEMVEEKLANKEK